MRGARRPQCSEPLRCSSGSELDQKDNSSPHKDDRKEGPPHCQPGGREAINQAAWCQDGSIPSLVGNVGGIVGFAAFAPHYVEGEGE
ncbi:hypothetical protein E2320_006326 [Naja naja]|nr:hypothetical protein E2320_006326 [Naja naja]